ncbi:OprD family outer membrane porin [Sulfurovum sp. NBC37-1]|uniref:OprD family outer membrane porin n=1 Tax=Sulfurovum sp. (strain NBC37-1) TaxID=387093 RepID=UPI00015874C4|nr:OprD family outer membrane porin [Sulfurovum sp. NBC37-1]BAF71764.1 hypothetical protein SUN_0806 [Sulfurovum sp. NBC37-1]
MKFTKLSLIAALAVSAAVAGGDIAPAPAPVEEAPQTTIDGKLTGYYITADNGKDYSPTQSYDMFDKDWSQLGLAATLDVNHKFTDNIAMNLSAIGYVNTNRDIPFDYIGEYFEGEPQGAFINVANITATFMDTTFILGRQLLNTPMLAGFDWLLAPGSFEAYTVANHSIENVTLLGSYVRTWRPNNAGNNWIDFTSDSDMQAVTGDPLAEGGNNWTVSAAYDNEKLSGSIWYYNVDAMNYTQFYVDGGYDFDVAKLAAQYVYTDWDNEDASNVIGVKATATLGSFNLMAAYTNISDNVAGWVGVMDGLYTSSWNTASGGSEGNNFKVKAATEFAGLTASASYAYYEYDQNSIAGTEDDGYEVDVILGYDFKSTDIVVIKDMDLNVVYTNTDYGLGGDTNALEIYANYKF